MSNQIELARARWDALFRRWSKPLSDTEEAKADNAARIIRDALRAYPPLEFRNVEVYATGSYRNNTNVRGESDIDVAAVSEVWRRGSVVASWLLNLTAAALQESPALDDYAGRVSDSGEGRWTSIAAIDTGTPAPVLTAALYDRFSSRAEGEFAHRVLSAMRHQFGGHLEKPGIARVALLLQECGLERLQHERAGEEHGERSEESEHHEARAPDWKPNERGGSCETHCLASGARMSTTLTRRGSGARSPSVVAAILPTRVCRPHVLASS